MRNLSKGFCNKVQQMFSLDLGGLEWYDKTNNWSFNSSQIYEKKMRACFAPQYCYKLTFCLICPGVPVIKPMLSTAQGSLELTRIIQNHDGGLSFSACNNFRYVLLSIKINEAHFDKRPYKAVAAWRHWTTYRKIVIFETNCSRYVPEIDPKNWINADVLGEDGRVLKWATVFACETIFASCLFPFGRWVAKHLQTLGNRYRWKKVGINNKKHIKDNFYNFRYLWLEFLIPQKICTISDSKMFYNF